MTISLSQALTHARQYKKQITLLSSTWNLKNKFDAIHTMQEVAQQLAWPRLGWKIAATNTELQKKLHTTHPVFGITYRPFLVSSPATLNHDELLDPIIECEFAFELAADLPKKSTPYTFNEIVEKVKHAYLCIEVAECRFSINSLPSSLYLMADGFASGWYILGTSINDWQDKLQKGVDVSLYRNQRLHSTGHSSDVMGHPLNPLIWLANELHSHQTYLKKGELISTGSCNILSKARKGDTFTATYEDIGTINVTT